jgi:Zn-finger protein
MTVPRLDGSGITFGSEKCRCTPDCEWPCWQRIGVAPPCAPCYCPDWPNENERLAMAYAHGVAVGQGIKPASDEEGKP